MIPQFISKHVLTIGSDYKKTQGGIAQILSSYSKLFEQFNFIPTTFGNNKMIKAGVMLTALIRVIVQSIFGNYKIIHIHGASYNSFKRKKYFIHLAKFFHKKVIYHIHGGGFEEFYNQNKKEVKNVLLEIFFHK